MAARAAAAKRKRADALARSLNEKNGVLKNQNAVFREGREGVEPSRDGFAIRCLSHLATAPNEIWVPWVKSTGPAELLRYSEYIGSRSRHLKTIPVEISEETICGFGHTWQLRLPQAEKMDKIANIKL